MQAVTPTPLARIYRGPGRLAESGNSTLTEHQRRVHFWRELFNHAFQRRHPVAETREVSDSRSVSPFFERGLRSWISPKKTSFSSHNPSFFGRNYTIYAMIVPNVVTRPPALQPAQRVLAVRELRRLSEE